MAVRCKPATAVQCRQVVDKYILPEFGKVPLTAVERGHVIDLHHKLSGVPAMANLVIATLSRMFNQAEAWELVSDGVNPCRFVHKYQERKRERFLTEEEFRRLGRVLSEAGNGTGVSARAAAAIRLLLMTGCRRNEVLTLRWEDVDLDAGELHLSDSKTGARAVPLSPSAAKLVAELPRVPGTPWVFPGKKPGAHMRNINGPWEIVRARGRDRECTAPRPAALVCFQGSGARRELADDREIVGTHADRNDGALCAPGPRLGAGVGGPDRRQHCRGHSAPPNCQPSSWMNSARLTDADDVDDNRAFDFLKASIAIPRQSRLHQGSVRRRRERRCLTQRIDASCPCNGAALKGTPS